METRKNQSIIYTTDEENEILKNAAKLMGLPLGSFVRSSAIKEARKILRLKNG